MKKNVLVTGAAGFIGSFVVDELIAMGLDVVALDNLSGGFRENVHPGARFVRGSVNDERLVGRLFKKHKFYAVYHLAAYAAEGLSHFIKRFNYENNLIGSMNLINASVNHGVRCFVFTSSIAVYGKNQLPMREDMTPLPEDSYGIAKLAVEEELKISKAMFGLDYVIFRPHNVYGERQNIGDRYRNVIGIFMNRILQGQPLPVFGDGRQTRAFTYIKDISPVIARAAFTKKAYGQVFNIGADTNYTVMALAKSVINAMGAQGHAIKNHPSRNEVKHAYSDHSKVEKFFAHKSHTPLDQGLRRMAAWVKEHGAKKSKDFKNIEIRKNLPPSWAR